MQTTTQRPDSLPQFDADSAIQQTLASVVQCTGIGVHSGEKTTLTLKPAAPDSGIKFYRIDLEGIEGPIPADWNHVIDTTLSTVIGHSAHARVGTIEHLMSALHGCGIDNATIEIDGPEVPIMDGSAKPFVFLVECAGICKQNTPRKIIKVLQEVSVIDNGRKATLKPSDHFSISVEIAFDHPVLRKQTLDICLNSGVFKSEIARARTFGFLHEAEKLKAANLALGASLENTVVIGEDAILNPEGLRYTDEFVRHKILDCVGDLYLCGYPIVGAFTGIKTGHYMHNQLLKKLFATPEAWEIITLEEPVQQIDN